MNALSLISTFLPALTQAAGIITQLWPQAAPAIGALATVTPPANQVNIVSLIQEALNALQAAGQVNFGNPLVVDGRFGGRTFAAIKLAQAKFGFAVQEPLASMEYNLLAAVLAKL